MAWRYRFRDLEEEVLEMEKRPLSAKDIWKKGVEHGLDAKVGTNGKTPWNSVSAQIYVSIRDDAESPFVQASKHPALFFLRIIPLTD